MALVKVKVRGQELDVEVEPKSFIVDDIPHESFIESWHFTGFGGPGDLTDQEVGDIEQQLWEWHHWESTEH